MINVFPCSSFPGRISVYTSCPRCHYFSATFTLKDPDLDDLLCGSPLPVIVGGQHGREASKTGSSTELPEGKSSATSSSRDVG